MTKNLMFQGTGSDVGKSILATALCRILTQDGYRVAPFKSQNMALNSYVTRDGGEIGRAQGVQADACGVEATTDMNPILIKPAGEMRSQIVVHGKPYADMTAQSYRDDFFEKAWAVLSDSYRRLEKRADWIVIEGAGSPAEINLKDREIVNMRVARWFNAPVILIADIDRGGVFAQIIGTMELLEPEERERVVGFLINKFRGDPSLLESGIRWLEERTGKPVLGLIPYLPHLDIEAEDSVALDAKPEGEDRAAGEKRRIRIAVIRHPHLSNFTDFDPLEAEEDVHLYYVRQPQDLGWPDAIILPGSKNTSEDLLAHRKSGLANAVVDRVQRGTRLVGICAGYQMLGHRLLDPDRVESDISETEGLCFFPFETVYAKEKRTVRVEGYVDSYLSTWSECRGLPVEGYEIHMGWMKSVSGEETATKGSSEPSRGGPLFQVASKGETVHPDGWTAADSRVWGTYLHGIFDNDSFRRFWLNEIRREKGWPVISSRFSHSRRREAAFDRLAAHVRKYTDWERLYRVLEEPNTSR
ncbi:cobyric acid synthase [Paludifilum halophilum]|uniref:Cobyric acid synthase n=1 Tax=Paludifilum halophilum TaxID=1642702 RepID=A0A235B919_9BACL|nr:cobyric acid synthase [Paludifilum halophilum]OYD08800.1 cobyric acid synthase CobQ [Paludifilum halophilum]